MLILQIPARQSISRVVLRVVLVGVFVWAQIGPRTGLAPESQKIQKLSTAIQAHPNSLVGYTLFSTERGYKPKRAMVLDVDTGNSFEVLPALRVAPQVTSQFVGWLQGHRKAVLQVGIWPGSMDQYIVDFESGQFFTPTVVEKKLQDTPIHSAGLMPYKKSAGDAGYTFVELDVANQTGKLQKMHFDGTSKMPLFNTSPFGIHGCSTLADLATTACELKCDVDPSLSHNGSACIQPFKIATGARTGRQLGPTLLGAAMWSADGKRYVFLQGRDRSSLQVVSVDLSDGTTHLLGCQRDPCSDVTPDYSHYVVHVLSPWNGDFPSPVPGDGEFRSGSDLGEWAVEDGVSAFYFSAVQAVQGGDYSHSYNQIGRVLFSNPYRFEPLTPNHTNARYPAPAPLGSSFVYVADMAGTGSKGCVPTSGESCVQIYLYDAKNKRNEQKTHFPPGWVPSDPKWNVMNPVKIPTLPSTGPDTGTFLPVNCGSSVIAPGCLDH